MISMPSGEFRRVVQDLAQVHKGQTYHFPPIKGVWMGGAKGPRPRASREQRKRAEPGRG